VESQRRVQRIGIFGGTFDPPHTGHVVIAAQSVSALNLDRLIVAVANDPWQKRDVAATATDRLALAAIAFDGVERVEVSDIEIRRGGPTYTVDTVEALLSPGDELFVIIGADAARQLPTWHRAAALAELVTIVVVARDGDDIDPISGFRSIKVDVSRVDVASSEVRERVARGEPIDGLVPRGVIHELRARRLYTP
jgi:nicotinate-nucleotide adenylyltransferase